MKKSVVRVVMLILAVAMVFSACGNQTKPTKKQHQQSESTSDQENGSFTVTDLAGVEHTFQKPLEHVVVQWSCAGGPFMTMSALLGEDIADYVVGIDNTPSEYRADMWEQYIKSVPGLKDIPVIGSVDEELNLEAVLASGADAMIFPLELKSIVDDTVGSKLEAAGIPAIYVDFHQESIENHSKSTLLLGRLFGKEERAQEIVDFYVAHREAVTKKVNEILKTKERPDIYIEVAMLGPSEFGNSFTNNYSWGGIAYESGGNSIGDGVLTNQGALDSEYVLSQNPDKIVFTGSYWPSKPESVRMGFDAVEKNAREQMNAYFTRAGWQELKAYKDSEVYAIHHGMAREMYDCACFEFFAKICFPEEMGDLDPNATLKEYYEKFLPYEFDGLWFTY